MRSNNYKSVLKHAGLAATVLLLASGVAFGQQVNLTAARTTTTLPDGSVVPMWGYSCDAVQPTGSTATCAALNTTVPAGSWSPVVITVPTGTDLQINLTNNLSFGTAPNNIPTSLVIVGQLGGGLGTPGSSTASPDHTKAQPVTWPIAADAAGAPLGTTVGSTLGTPPTQGPRVPAFSTDVALGTAAPLRRGASATGGPAPAAAAIRGTRMELRIRRLTGPVIRRRSTTPRCITCSTAALSTRQTPRPRCLRLRRARAALRSPARCWCAWSMPACACTCRRSSVRKQALPLLRLPHLLPAFR